jgi:hypothetical protein
VAGSTGKKTQRVRRVVAVEDRYIVYVDAATVARLRRIAKDRGWEIATILRAAVYLWDISARSAAPLVGAAKLERAAKEQQTKTRGPGGLDVDGAVRRMARELGV